MNEQSILDALVVLVLLGEKDSFVVIEEPASAKFVQFGKGPRLEMDVPCCALSEDEASRAAKFYLELGELCPRQYRAPNPKTGKVHFGATYNHDFGTDARAAAAAAVAFFEKVYQVPRDVELTITQH